MKITKYLDGWLEGFDEHGLSTEYLSHLVDEFKHLLLLDVEWTHSWDSLLTLSGGEQVLDEEGVKRLVVVLLNERSLDVRAELTWLFL